MATTRIEQGKGQCLPDNNCVFISEISCASSENYRLMELTKTRQMGMGFAFGPRRSKITGFLLLLLCLMLFAVNKVMPCWSIVPVDAFLIPASVAFLKRRTARVFINHHILFAKSKKKKKTPDNTVAVNRIAYRNYEIVDTLEAGISLKGTEVKSIRDGKLNLRDGYVRPAKNGRSCVLFNVHVGKCSQVGADYFQHEEKRPRTLLVHKAQARKFLQQTEQQGMTVIPLKAYWNDENKLKLQIALCRGKNVRDKRATIRERDSKRETNRIIKNFRI